MDQQEVRDPISLIIKACHNNEKEAKRIYHQLVEQHQGSIKLDNDTTIRLKEEQVEEFVKRYSSEVEPAYWESKRLKH